MSRNGHSLWSWIGLLAVVIALGAIVAYLTEADERFLTLVQAVVAVVALGIPAVLWLARRRQPASQTPGDATPANTADELAAVVKGQWEKAAIERGLRYPAPIPVQWRWSDQGIAGSVTEAVGTLTARRLLPLPGMPRVTERLERGSFADLFRIYAGLDSGRMIISGGPGAGKTGAAILLLLTALTHRQDLEPLQRARTPVPVLLTLSGWDPYRTGVEDWLVQRLTVDYPFLAAGPDGSGAARLLLRDGLVAIFLDGLDEVPEPTRPRVVQALNAQVHFRLVLLSRTLELTAAIDGQYHLVGAAAVELERLLGNDIADYLGRCQVQPLAPSWQRIVDHAGRRPDSVITQALDSPLMLTLVRDTLTAGELDSVLDPDRYFNRHEVEDVLLDRVLLAGYHPRSGRPVGRYTLEQARHWLGYLAYRMNQDSTRDLAWWQISAWTATPMRLMMHVVFQGTAIGLLNGLTGGLAFGIFSGLVGSLLSWIINERTNDRRPMMLNQIQFGRFFATGSAVTGSLFALATGAAGWVEVVVIFGGGLTDGIVFAAATAIITVLVYGFLIGAKRSKSADDTPVDPLESWRGDWRAGVVVGLWFIPAGALWSATLISLDPTFMQGPLAGAVPKIALGGFMSFIYGLLTIQARFTTALTCLQLYLKGVAPLPIIRFLNNAHERHILRSVGPVYQFRHARIQDRLAADFSRAIGATTSRPPRKSFRKPGCGFET